MVAIITGYIKLGYSYTEIILRQLTINLSFTVPMQMIYEPIQILNDRYHGFIKCQVRGGPIPEVSWSFKGENIGI